MDLPGESAVWGLLFDFGILGAQVVLNVCVLYATVCILKGQTLGIVERFLIWYTNYLFCLFHSSFECDFVTDCCQYLMQHDFHSELF